MKRTAVIVMSVLFIIATAGLSFAASGIYLNGGVSVYDPTIGLNAEFQYDNFSAIIGAGALAYNNFGYGAGLKFYLFGIDGGPFIGASYGTTGTEPVNTHLDSAGDTVVDTSRVFQGISAIAGWRLFFAEGWNLNLGMGASNADNRALWTFDFTAGYMLFGDEDARKNAEKYRREVKSKEEEDMGGQSNQMTEPNENTVETEPAPEAMPDTTTAKQAAPAEAAANTTEVKQAMPEAAVNTQSAKAAPAEPAGNTQEEKHQPK